jgi:hypothetical protein
LAHNRTRQPLVGEAARTGVTAAGRKVGGEFVQHGGLAERGLHGFSTGAAAGALGWVPPAG